MTDAAPTSYEALERILDRSDRGLPGIHMVGLGIGAIRPDARDVVTNETKDHERHEADKDRDTPPTSFRNLVRLRVNCAGLSNGDAMLANPTYIY